MARVVARLVVRLVARLVARLFPEKTEKKGVELLDIARKGKLDGR